ncbi:RPII140-upstream gene protein-like [Ornithodoros turicata]|uniref:RPII140-upstream gene protein-like n=1 Tax=Ornithodoros turicata TaxID=34597 RepID=UPI00313961E7
MWFSQEENYDVVSEINRPADFNELDILKNETGWDRLRTMYSLEFGLSPELQFVQKAAGCGGVAGAVFGGINFARQAKENFIRSNQASAFMSPVEATRQMYDKMLLELYRGAWRFGWRTTLFSGLYVAASISGSVFRNKFGIAEHAAAGALCGMFFKANMGLRGTVAGLVVGTTLGSLCGASIYFTTKMSGVTMAEYRYWSHDYWLKEYNEKKKQQKAKAAQLKAEAEGSKE